jgi:hypothetical protein
MGMTNGSLTNKELDMVLIAVNSWLIENKTVARYSKDDKYVKDYQMLRVAYSKLMTQRKDRGPVNRKFKMVGNAVGY